MDYVNNIIIYNRRKHILIYDIIYLQLYQFVSKRNKIIFARRIKY